ncbi:cyclic nucleotide-binding domain-containing protein 1 [Clupea harengus]|uniref:Cyclic nucleotide-binding domain-containing protein 1 n=1 Tax=Clupea harengus TaxID=7950 RepID=A0A6P3VS52_CLUHA|nr:cyclic nucleotide-binding domain-containing protein 1 [Clupea harengus]
MSLKTICRQEIGDPNITGIDYSRLEALCNIHGLECSDDKKASEEAHRAFMSSYQQIFIRAPKPLPRIPWHEDNKTSVPGKDKLGETLKKKPLGAKPKLSSSRPSHDSIVSQMIRAAKKFPVERSQSEHQLILSALKLFPVLIDQIDPPELYYISRIVMIETLDRGHIIFAESGFYIVLRGSVRPYTDRSSPEEKKPEIGVGGSFGSLQENPEESSSTEVIRCVQTQEPCEILKIPNASYAKLRKDLQRKDFELKVSLIERCNFYLNWTRLPIHKLANLIQMKNFPANHVLAKEGKVCQFVAFIHQGECNILQDIETLMKPLKRGNCIVVGQLGPFESIGEVSLLMDTPSPCTIITRTPVQAGIIPPDILQELDSVTRSLMLQSAKPTCGKLTEEEISKQYMRQERQKEWEHVKKKVLSDSLFYNGIQHGVGKWTLNRSQKMQ